MEPLNNMPLSLDPNSHTSIPQTTDGSFPRGQSSHVQSYGEVHAHDRSRVLVGNSYQINHYGPSVDVRQNLVESFSFPQIHHRRDQISDACPTTYQWVLNPSEPGVRRWDCFIDWLTVSDGQKILYWVSGKPGSGKSTLMRYLYEHVKGTTYFTAWARGKPVLQLSHFFWSSGNQLEKSVNGLLRSCIVGILRQREDLIDQVLATYGKPVFKQASDWNRRQLVDCFFALLQRIAQDSKVLILLDGLDECHDLRGEQEDLILILQKLQDLDFVKLCVSSRSYNIYKDAFGKCLRLRLEDLNQPDIEAFVGSKFNASPRWHEMTSLNPKETTGFAASVAYRAEGVFLWAVLAMRTVIADLQDGDTLPKLEQRLDELPRDLSDFFLRIVESIEQRHRYEASVLLQLAVWEETESKSYVSFSLLDAIFTGEQLRGSILQDACNSSFLPMNELDRFQSLSESLFRKINGRCKGLLECITEDAGPDYPFAEEDVSYYDVDPYEEERPVSCDSERIPLLDNLNRIFNTRIAPLHRSLRDFLSDPTTQQVLNGYTKGQAIDSRLYLINARLTQVLALDSVAVYSDLMIVLLDDLLSALSLYKEVDICEIVAFTLSGVVEHLVENWGPLTSDNDLCLVLRTWFEEQSNFLSVAIEFELSRYVLNHLTPKAIETKRARPLLDYILRPRVRLSPRKDFLEAALACGANPNEQLQEDEVTVWSSFLCDFADWFLSRYNKDTPGCDRNWYDCLQMLVQAGAALVLPVNSLSIDPELSVYYASMIKSSGDPRFFPLRWPDVKPVCSSEDESGNKQDMYAVSDLVEAEKDYLDFDITPLLEEMRTRERDICASLVKQKMSVARLLG